MGLEPRISRCASGKRSRSSLTAGNVRTKSPMAPPRMTRIRFRSVLNDGAGQNGSAVEKKDAVSDAPAAVRPRAPADLVAQQVRHRHPDKASHNQEIGEHGDEQTAALVSEERSVEKRFGGEQNQNAERAGGQKFVDKPEHEKKPHRQNEEKWFSEAGKFSHLHGGEKPEAPKEGNRQQNEAGHARARKLSSRSLRRGRLSESPQAEDEKENACDVASGLEREVIDHAKIGEDGCMTGVPYKLNPVASST